MNLKNRKENTPLRRGILHTTRRTTPLGNFRFLPEVTVQNILSPIEEITSKAPRAYNTFITIKTASLDEGGIIGEKFILEQVYTIFDNLWAADSTMVIYTYPGKIQHSSYVIPNKKKHTRVPQLKIHKKIASLPENKRYKDGVLVYNQKCTYINLFIGHSIPMDELMNTDVEYQVVNDQMQLIVKDVQAPESITIVWLVGMDPVTTNCKELAKILQGFKHFSKLPIHVKIQQLLIKTDDKFERNDSWCVKVVTIQCAHHLRKVTMKALKKTFNSVKPKDVKNRPNGTNAKMVPWYLSVPMRSLQQTRVQYSGTKL